MISQHHDFRLHRTRRLAYLGTLALLFLASLGALPLSATPEDPAEEAVRGWPREYLGDDFRLVAYQPQVSSWDDYRRIEAHIAVMISLQGRDEPLAGALRLAAETDTHFDTRTVFLHDLEIVESRFPSTAGPPAEELARRVRSVFPDELIAVSLDRMLAMVERSEIQSRPVDLGDEPPMIYVEQAPAVLVVLDGEPMWKPIGDRGLHYAVNTNWDLFKYDGEKKTNHRAFYLLYDGAWLAADTIEGTWQAAEGKLPKALRRLPDDGNFRQARAAAKAKKDIASSELPIVGVSKRPAELIVLRGQPDYVPIADTPLLYVKNTDADVFKHTDDNRFYYLVSGRWFRSSDLDGLWQSAMGELPDGFGDLPEDHAKGHVLASVPGTRQAEEAIIQAQIPQVASVSREDAPKEVKVAYAGEPQFRAVEGADLSYAVNTEADVLRLGDVYYLCQSGVWFLSSTPTGPWTVADEVPDQIYTIPASEPIHHVTYVRVYDSTPDVVVYGYTGGYYGVYVGWGSVVWGTGWWYDPWHYYDPWHSGYPYPIYYAYPYTFGAGTWYNPATGFYGRGAAYYGPYGGVGRGAAYNPRTGTYARGGALYGAHGGSAWAHAYNPRTGARSAGYRSYNSYSAWGRGVVARGDQWIEGGFYSDARGTVRGARTSEGGRAATFARDGQRTAVAQGRGGDVFVGRDGEVYRRDGDGWSKYAGGRGDSWQPVDRGASDRITDAQRQQARDRAASGQGRDVIRELDRSAVQRQRGAARSGRYESWQGRGGWSGSYGGRGIDRSRLRSRGGGRRR